MPINDVPKFFLKNPIVNDHTVIIPSDIDDSSLLILLMLQHVTSYFPVRATTLYLNRGVMSSQSFSPDVGPQFVVILLAGRYMLDFRGCFVSTVTMSRRQITTHVNSVPSSLIASFCVIDATDDNNFDIYLESFVQISLTSTSRKAAVSHDELAKHWGIHPDCAKAMVQCTTQRGVQIIANPALSQQFQKNDCMLQYRCFHHLVFTNMMFL